MMTDEKKRKEALTLMRRGAWRGTGKEKAACLLIELIWEPQLDTSDSSMVHSTLLCLEVIQITQ